MTLRTEPPDLRRHLARLEARVDQLEGRNRTRRTTQRPKPPTFGLLDAKGDLIAATAADTAERLPVGANNLLLVPDSSTTTGLRWGLPVLPGVVVRRTTPQNVPDAAESIITWQEEVGADPFGMWDIGSANWVTCQRTARYLAWCNINWQSDDTGQRSLHLEVDRGAGWVAIADDHRPAGTNTIKHSNAALRVIDLTVGNRVRATALQQTYAPFGPQTLNILADAEYSPYMGLQWVSDL